MPGERELDGLEAKLAFCLCESLVPGGAARRPMEAIVEEEQVAERGFDPWLRSQTVNASRFAVW
jgi:hypothetical protein